MLLKIHIFKFAINISGPFLCGKMATLFKCVVTFYWGMHNTSQLSENCNAVL